MDETIEVLGCAARHRRWLPEEWTDAETPLGTVRIGPHDDGCGWCATWWPKWSRLASVDLVTRQLSPADAAREATRRLRAITRTCARAGAV